MFVAPPTPDHIIVLDASVVILAIIETDEAQKCCFFLSLWADVGTFILI